MALCLASAGANNGNTLGAVYPVGGVGDTLGAAYLVGGVVVIVLPVLGPWGAYPIHHCSGVAVAATTS